MRSAYLLLGVPGDASPAEIDDAYRRASQLFTKERLATEDGALARLAELKDAYRVLRDPASRAAHDRKLAAPPRAPAPRTIVVERQEASPVARAAVIGICLVAAVFSAGAYISHRNSERRQQMEAQERADRQAAEREATRRQQEADRLEAQRAQAAAKAEAAERRLILESQSSAARAQAEVRSQEMAVASARRNEEAEARRQEQARLAEERRVSLESQRRIERDKQKVRELCLQLYRRPDC